MKEWRGRDLSFQH